MTDEMNVKQDDVSQTIARHLAKQMHDAGYDEAAEYMLSEWIGRCIRACLATEPEKEHG